MTCSAVDYRKIEKIQIIISNAQPLLVIIRLLLTMIIMSMTVLRNELSCYIVESVISGSSQCVYKRWRHITYLLML